MTSQDLHAFKDDCFERIVRATKAMNDDVDGDPQLVHELHTLCAIHHAAQRELSRLPENFFTPMIEEHLRAALACVDQPFTTLEEANRWRMAAVAAIKDALHAGGAA